MKQSKLFLILLFFVILSCKDEDLQPLPEWETGVNAFSKLSAGSKSSFTAADLNSAVSFDFRWISIDKLNTITKVEFYVLFNESFIDKDNNPALARHGGSSGKLIAVLEGDQVKGNKEDMKITITPLAVYELYKNNKFAYCGAEVNVFGNDLKPVRSADVPFLAGDTFTVRWKLFAEDGRVFDSWSPSVCTEFPGSNCKFDFAVSCSSDLAFEYDYSTTITNVGWPGGAAAVGDIITGSGSFTKSTSTGVYTCTDASFGLFGYVYDDSPVTKVTFKDVCGLLSFGGTDQYGDSYKFTFVSNDGQTLVFDWLNTYNDGGRTSLTIKDANFSWPANLTSTPSGSCLLLNK